MGATIVHHPKELKEDNVGMKCRLIAFKKIGDKYFTFLTECKSPKACSVMLRDTLKEVLNDIECNLNNTLQVVRNLMQEPHIVHSSGAVKMALGMAVVRKAESIEGEKQWPLKVIRQALEVILRILVANSLDSTIRAITSLKAKQTADM